MGWEGRDYVAFGWATTAIYGIMVAVRLYIDRLGIRSVSIPRDILLVVLLICSTLCCIFDSIMNDHDLFNEDSFMFMTNNDDTGIEYVYKMAYIQGFFYTPSLYLCKFDLLSLYNQLAPRSVSPKVWWSTAVTWGLSVSSFLAVVFFHLARCRPISDNWTVIAVNNCAANESVFGVTWVPHLVTDVLLYIIPLVIIFNAKKMILWEKLSAASMFLVGFMNVFTAMYLAIYTMTTRIPSRTASGVQTFMVIIQQCTAVWILCMPQMKNMYRFIMRNKVKTAGDVSASLGVLESAGGDLEKMPSAIGSDVEKVKAEEEKEGFDFSDANGSKS